jgi:hypothetical protein
MVKNTQWMALLGNSFEKQGGLSEPLVGKSVKSEAQRCLLWVPVTQVTPLSYLNELGLYCTLSG